MGRASTIDELPDEIKSEIGRLRLQGATIDELVKHLRSLHVGVSRSALGRHVKSMGEVAEKMRRSRDVATALVRELGDEPESQIARLNIELLHSAILDLTMRAADGETVDEDGKAALDGNPMGIMLLAKSLDHLTKSTRTDADFRMRIEAAAIERTKREAAAAVDQVQSEKGITAATANAIKARIFGVKAAAGAP
jgi:hypothetical protein